MYLYLFYHYMYIEIAKYICVYMHVCMYNIYNDVN